MAEERTQRRLAAILAADVVGYGRLMEQDEADTLAALKARRKEVLEPLVARHQGRIFKVTGDGVLVAFASAVNAVQCAVDLQHGMTAANGVVPEDRPIVLRIGVHLADVMVEGSDFYGDGVNIAARLEGIAEPGGICLSGPAFDQVNGKVNAAFVDLGERLLKNMERPVRVYAVKTGAGTPPLATRGSASSNSGAPRLSIVVLPLANLGGDKEQDYFVDGVTESLTTDLSRIPGAFVIACNTAFTFKGKAVDTKQLGRELGVRYVLEGSVQAGADRVRVNAQLIDSETGAHIWAERIDKPRADLFDMQDEITARLARAVGIELVAAESRRAERERPNNMDAVDLSMRGWAMMNQPQSFDRTRQAPGLFEAALRLDDRNVDALIGLAQSHVNEVRFFASVDRDKQMRIAETAIAKALTLAPNSALAHFVHGEVLHALRAPELALREFELAISLDRNLAWAHADAGFMKVLLGHAEEAETHIAEAMRLSPRDPGLDRWYALLGIADFFIGRLDRAVDRLRKSVETNPNLGLPFFFLAAALALMDRDAEAAAACAAARSRLQRRQVPR